MQRIQYRNKVYGKNTVRINESQLRDMIAESVKKVLNEADVVRGTNIDKLRFHSADDYREYTDVADEAKFENDKVPDFVLTLANRLETTLNKKYPVDLKYPEKVRRKLFDVEAHVDNNASAEEYLTQAYSYMERNIIFRVNIDNRLHPEFNIKKLQQDIMKTAYLVLGSIEDSELNFKTDWSGVDVILTIREETNIQHHGYFNGNERAIKSGSKLFAHNPSRQIGKEGSTYQDDEEY